MTHLIHLILLTSALLGILYALLVAGVLLYLKLESLRSITHPFLSQNTTELIMDDPSLPTSSTTSSTQDSALLSTQLPIEHCFVLSSQENIAYLLTDESLSTAQTASLLQAISFFSSKGLSYKIISSQNQECLVANQRIPVPINQKKMVFQFPDQLFIQN